MPEYAVALEWRGSRELAERSLRDATSIGPARIVSFGVFEERVGQLSPLFLICLKERFGTVEQALAAGRKTRAALPQMTGGELELYLSCGLGLVRWDAFISQLVAQVTYLQEGQMGTWRPGTWRPLATNTLCARS